MAGHDGGRIGSRCSLVKKEITQNSLKSLLHSRKMEAQATFSPGVSLCGGDGIQPSSSMPLDSDSLLPEETSDVNFASLLRREFYTQPSSVLVLLATILAG